MTKKFARVNSTPQVILYLYNLINTPSYTTSTTNMYNKDLQRVRSDGDRVGVGDFKGRQRHIDFNRERRDGNHGQQHREHERQAQARERVVNRTRNVHGRARRIRA